MRDFRVKWGICEEKMRDFRLNGGFAKRKPEYWTRVCFLSKWCSILSVWKKPMEKELVAAFLQAGCPWCKINK